jgi:hypothetical protein
VIDTKHWLRQAQRIDADDEYTYSDLARELVARLGWTAALNVATALRSFVYGQPGGSDLHKAVEPLYRRLGWEQSALVACWFRDARNRPGRRPGGWPAAATPTPKESS